MRFQGNDLVLGTDHRGRPIRLSREDRSRHVYAVGTTGSGKSKFLEGLIRQDILAWAKSRCGMMVLDLDGQLFDGVMGWLAERDLRHLPVVPLDLRRSDWVVSYNPLRHRAGMDPAPLVAAIVRAILHAWGQSEAADTPRLLKWLTTLLMTLYHSKLTLAEALDVIRSPAIRREMSRTVEDSLSRAVWQSASFLKEAQFQEQLESTMNRLCKFLGTQVLRLALSQSGQSLDLGSALEKGSIVIASLASEGWNADEEDAAALAGILLSDLWTAAKARGKREAGAAKPFYLYLDEFQEYTQPSIAKGLARARGFGLHLTLAHQSMTQLRDAGPIGVEILNSVLANARTKVAFQTEHPDDLETLALWLFRHNVDTDQIKHRHESTKVLGYEVEYLPTYSSSSSSGTSAADTWSDTDALGQNVGLGIGRSESAGTSATSGESEGRSDSAGQTDTAALSRGESRGESEEEGRNWGRAASRSRQRGLTLSEAKGLSGDLRPIDWEDKELDFAEEFEDPGQASQAWTRSAALSFGDGDAETANSGGSRSAARSRAEQASRTDSTSKSRVKVKSAGTSKSHGISREAGASLTLNAGLSATRSRSAGGSATRSETSSEGVSEGPVLMPVMGREAQAPLFRSVEEQLFRFSQFLSLQPDRHCVVRIGPELPARLRTMTIGPAQIGRKGTKAWAALRYARLPYLLRSEEAQRRLLGRQQEMEARFSGGFAGVDEPETYGRKIKEGR